MVLRALLLLCSQNYDNTRANHRQTMRQCTSTSIILGLMALAAIFHLCRLNQDHLELSSDLLAVVKRRVVIQSPTRTMATITTAEAADAAASSDITETKLASLQQQQMTQHQPINCTTSSDADSVKNITLAAPEELKISANHARWLHIGKAGGGTFSERLKSKWKVKIRECHPNPCRMRRRFRDHFAIKTAILIRDPVDRFVSAFYWRAKVICKRAGVLYDPPINWKPPPKRMDDQDDEIDLIFNQSQTNVNLLAERLCRRGHDNDGIDFQYTSSTGSLLRTSEDDIEDSAYQQAARDVRLIGHLTASVVDWLKQSNVVATAAVLESSSLLTPIVLEPGFDFNSQIDAFVQDVLVNHTQVADANSESFVNRLAYVHHKDCMDEIRWANNKNNMTREDKKEQQSIVEKITHASPKENSIPLSEENIKCVARYYRQDYLAIRDLGQTYCTGATRTTCRLAIESIWNRRAHLLLE